MDPATIRSTVQVKGRVLVMALNVAHRGSLFHLLNDPRFHQDSVEFIEDGILLVSDGVIISAGPANEILDKLPAGTDVVRHTDAVLVPGFFDLHVHSPQLTTVAIYGEPGWLNTIIPEEEAYKDPKPLQSEPIFSSRKHCETAQPPWPFMDPGPKNPWMRSSKKRIPSKCVW